MREKASNQFRQLRRALKTSMASGLVRIDVPNSQAVLRPGEQVPRIPLVTKEEIEEVLVPHTERRFTQHQETPFGHGERQRELGIDGTSSDAQHLQQGTYKRDFVELLSSGVLANLITTTVLGPLERWKIIKQTQMSYDYRPKNKFNNIVHYLSSRSVSM